MKMSVTEFKAKCTQVLREVASKPYTVEITKRGKVVAIVSPPVEEPPPDVNPAWGCLRGTITYMAPDFDEPMDDTEWDACQ